MDTGGLRREQAGFRHREECVAHVASLIELAQRREKQGHPTYVAFIDLKKAFDTVPHSGLLYLLQKKGIQGKCHAFITALYAHGTFRVRAGDLISETGYPLHRGVRQGDTLSPVLFDLFIDSALDGLPGVEVPGIQGTIPGLLFADDMEIHADTPEALQQALDTLGAWCDRWHMAVGHDKCGVMVLGSPPLHDAAKSIEWRLQGSTISVVDQYTYLGVALNPALDRQFMMAARATIGRKALSAMYPFLSNTSVPLNAKVLAIKMLLNPKLTYGGELYGLHSHTDYRCLQQVQSEAMNLALRGKTTRTVSYLLLCVELDTPPISAILDGKAARAGAKWPSLATWIPDLLTQPGGRGSRTWSQHLRAMLTRLSNSMELQLRDMDPKALGRVIQDIRWRKLLAASSSPALDSYLRLHMDSSNSFLHSRVDLAPGTTGYRWLARARVGAIWTATRGRRAGLLTALEGDGCPSCGSPDPDTLAHLLLECPAFRASRRQELDPWIPHLATELRRIQDTTQSRVEMWQALLGGGTRELASLYATRTLESFAAPGAEGAPATHSSGTLCESVARYLGYMVPLHMSRVWTADQIRALIPPRVNAPVVRQPSSPAEAHTAWLR